MVRIIFHFLVRELDRILIIDISKQDIFNKKIESDKKILKFESWKKSYF